MGGGALSTDELERKIQAQAHQIKILAEGQQKAQDENEELRRLNAEREEEIQKVKNQAKQAMIKIKTQHQQEIKAILEQNSSGIQASDIGEGNERLKQALSEAEASRQRITDLEAQLSVNQESMEKIKTDAKKYVETLKKKEQEALAAAEAARKQASELLQRLNEQEGSKQAVDDSALLARISSLEQELSETTAKMTSAQESENKVKSQAKEAVKKLQGKLENMEREKNEAVGQVQALQNAMASLEASLAQALQQQAQGEQQAVSEEAGRLRELLEQSEREREVLGLEVAESKGVKDELACALALKSDLEATVSGLRSQLEATVAAMKEERQAAEAELKSKYDKDVEMYKTQAKKAVDKSSTALSESKALIDELSGRCEAAEEARQTLLQEVDGLRKQLEAAVNGGGAEAARLGEMLEVSERERERLGQELAARDGAQAGMTQERGELEATIGLLRGEAEAGQARYQNVSNQLAMLERTVQEQAARLAEAEAEVERMAASLRQSESQATALGEQLAEAQAESVSKAEKHANELAESKKQNSALKEKVKAAIEAGKQREKETNAKCDQLKDKCEELEKKLKEATALLSQKEAEGHQAAADLADLRAELASKDSELQQALSDLCAHEARAAELSVSCSQLAVDKDNLVRELGSLQASLEAEKSHVSSNDVQAQAASEHINNLNVLVAELKQQADAAHERAHALDQQLVGIQQERDALLARCRTQEEAGRDAALDSQTQLEQQIEKAEDEIAQLETRLQESMEISVSLQGQISVLHAQLAEKDSYVEALESQLQQERVKREQDSEEALQQLRILRTTSAEEAQRLRHGLERAENQADSLIAQLGEVQQAAHSDSDAGQQKWRACEEQLLKDLKMREEQFAAELQACERDVSGQWQARHDEMIATWHTREEQLLAQINEQLQRIDEMTAQQGAMQNAMASLEASLAQTSQTLAAVEREKNEAVGQVQALQNAMASLEASLAQTSQTLAAVEREKNEAVGQVQALQQQAQGEQQAVSEEAERLRELLEQSEREREVLGLEVAESKGVKDELACALALKSDLEATVSGLRSQLEATVAAMKEERQAAEAELKSKYDKDVEMYKTQAKKAVDKSSTALSESKALIDELSGRCEAAEEARQTLLQEVDGLRKQLEAAVNGGGAEAARLGEMLEVSERERERLGQELAARDGAQAGMTQERGELEATIGLLRGEAEAGQARYQNVSNQLAMLERTVQEQAARLAEAEAEVERMAASLRQSESQATALGEQLAEAQAESVSKAEKHANELAESKKQNSALKEKVKAAIEAGKQREKETNAKCDQLKDKCEELEKKLKEATALLSQKDADAQQAAQNAPEDASSATSNGNTHMQERALVETLVTQYCQDVSPEGKSSLDLLDLLLVRLEAHNQLHRETESKYAKDRRDWDAQKQELEAAVAEEHTQAAKAKEIIETLRAQSKKAEAANSKAMSDLKDKFDELKVENDELKARVSGDNATLVHELEKAQLEVETAQNALEDAVRRAAALESDKAQLQSDLAQLQDELTQLQNDKAQLQSDSAQLQGELAQSQNDKAQLQSDSAQLQGELAQLQNDKAQLQSDVAQLQNELARQKQKDEDFRKTARQALTKAKEKEKELKDKERKLLAAQKSATNMAAGEQTNGLVATPARRESGAEQAETLQLQVQHRGQQDGAGNEDDSSGGGGTHSASTSNAKSPSGADDDVTSVVSVTDSAHTPTSAAGEAVEHKFASDRDREHASTRPAENNHAPNDAHSHSDSANTHGGSARSISSDVADVSAAEYRERALRLLEDKDRHIAELKAKLKAVDKGAARLALPIDGDGGAGRSKREEELARSVEQLNASLKECERMYRMQVDVLKREVSALQQRVKAEGIPFEYLKEVVVNFILASPQLGVGPREHEDMIPVLADLFQFSEADRTRVATAQARARNKSLLSSATDFLIWGR